MAYVCCSRHKLQYQMKLENRSALGGFHLHCIALHAWVLLELTVVYEALKCNSIIILLLVLLDDECLVNKHQAKL